MAVFNQHHVDGLDLTVNPLLYMMRCYPVSSSIIFIFPLHPATIARLHHEVHSVWITKHTVCLSFNVDLSIKNVLYALCRVYLNRN